MLRYVVILLALFASSAAVANWKFGKALAVSPYKGKTVFPHINASGRKNIAISGNKIGVVWEDNHNGSPQVYAAFKRIRKNRFSAPIQISSGKDAYDPTIVSTGHGNFVIGWEQDGNIWIRQVIADKKSMPARFGRTKGSQVSLAYADRNSVVAAWSHKQGRFSRIVTSKISLGKNRITAEKVQPVETEAPTQNQIYPNIVYSNGITTVVWEDRRRGHTRFLYANAKPGEKFSEPRVLNEVVQKSAKYGSGSGVTRVSLTTFDNNNVAAAWMDKRNFGTGYDVYAAFSNDDGINFSKNQKVQDDFAENIAQWHPAIAVNNRNTIVIVWDDNRDDTQDVWLSRKTPDGWSQDSAVPPASGDGEQSNPAVAMDDKGNLHLIWLDRNENNITRLFYSQGRVTKE